MNIRVNEVQARVFRQINPKESLNVIPELTERLLTIRIGVIKNLILDGQPGSDNPGWVPSLNDLYPEIIIGRKQDRGIISGIGAVHSQVIPGENDIFCAVQEGFRANQG